MNKDLLKSYMLLNKDTQTTLAKAMRLNRTTLAKKIAALEGKSFNRFEAFYIVKRYKLTPREARLVFDEYADWW